MKKYLFFSLLSVITFAANAQLTAPIQTNPADSDTGVYVNERLTWNASTGGLVTGYECHLDVDSNFSNPVNLPIYGTGAITSLLDYNQVYYWRVRAKNGSTNGPWSKTASYTTFNDEFTGLIPSSGERNPEVELKWDTISGSDSYTLEISTNPSFTGAKSFLVPKPKPDSAIQAQTRFLVKNLLFGTTYYWRVRANHSLDQSAFSNAASFSVIQSARALKPDDNETRKIYASTSLTCSNTNGIYEYRFQICDDSTFNANSPYFHTYIVYKKDYPPFFNTDGDLVIPPILVKAEYLSFGTTYFWRVQGVNNVNVSQWSDFRRFTTVDSITIDSPEDAAAGLGTRGIEFKWDRFNGVEGYIMELDTTVNFATPRFIETFGDTGTSVILDIDQTSANYYWRVRGYHFRDTSKWTSTRSFYGTPTGINSQNIEIGFELFPNPASDVVYFDLSSTINSNATIEVYNILGDIVDMFTLRNTMGKQRVTYNTAELQSGVYMVVFNLNDHRETHRLSIK